GLSSSRKGPGGAGAAPHRNRGPPRQRARRAQAEARVDRRADRGGSAAPAHGSGRGGVAPRSPGPRPRNARDDHKRKLESIAGLTAEEARRQLMAQVEVESRREAQLLAMRLEEEAKEVAHSKAKEVLATTIQRLAPDYTVEPAGSIVDLPPEDMKGRIIGREGRNIRALELHTGVD